MSRRQVHILLVEDDAGEDSHACVVVIRGESGLHAADFFILLALFGPCP